MLQPYEFLVRWDHLTGVLKGAHIKLFDTVTMQEGRAQAVAIAGASGFPIAEVLTAIEIGAIAAYDAAVIKHAAEIAAKDAEIAALKTEVVRLSPVP